MVRKPRTDGFYSVYIRIVHNRKPGYIKTDKIVDAWKSHATLTLLAKQDCPLWLQYD